MICAAAIAAAFADTSAQAASPAKGGSPMLEQVGAAFFGALFAFLFMWIWDSISKFNDRWARHYTGVVRLGRATNDQLASLSRAIFEVEQIVGGLAEAKKVQFAVPVSLNQPAPIQIDNSFEFDIINLDLVNDYVGYRSDIEDLNANINRLVSAKQRAEQGLADERLRREEYLYQMEQLSVWLQQLLRQLRLTRDEAATLTAKARVRARRDAPRFHKYTMRRRRTRNERDFGEAVARERTMLMGEIAAARAQAQQRTDHIENGGVAPGA